MVPVLDISQEILPDIWYKEFKLAGNALHPCCKRRDKNLKKK
jgi:hypothetical protein